MDEREFQRKEDMDHLSQIPVLTVKMENMEKQMTEMGGDIKVIKEGFQQFQLKLTEVNGNQNTEIKGVKGDVSWLKEWHNKIVLGLVLAILGGVASLTLTLLVRH